MKGFVLTPPPIVDLMVDKLFEARQPLASSVVLDPGCGTGAFVAGIERWARTRGLPMPRVIGIDSDSAMVQTAAARFADNPAVTICHDDFLTGRRVEADYIIGNPPYVAITSLTPEERRCYRERYRSAHGRFDLYLLFFEQALASLKVGGQLVFVTPEKFLYVGSASPIRSFLRQMCVEEFRFLPEDTFTGLITYPLITSLSRRPAHAGTRVLRRDGSEAVVQLGTDSSWQPIISGAPRQHEGYVLRDICGRISCGIATGADRVFVHATATLDISLRPFAHPSIAGRELTQNAPVVSASSILVPYDRGGRLMRESSLGAFGTFLREPEHSARLLERTCVPRKPWYAFHETPFLDEMLRPKILCKDIVRNPFFVADVNGELVPRHSIYYIVPNDPALLEPLTAYLNSPVALRWLSANCQRAANNYLRVQSHILKQLPVPAELVEPGYPRQGADTSRGRQIA